VETIITHKGVKNRLQRQFVVFTIIILLFGLNLNTHAENYLNFGSMSLSSGSSFTPDFFGYSNHKWLYSEKNIDRLTCQKSILGKKQGRYTCQKSVLETKQGKCTCQKSVLETKQGRYTCLKSVLETKQGRLTYRKTLI